MTVKSVQRILVIGAGRGGTAMLELFAEDAQIEIVGIFDANPDAPALVTAKMLGIRNFSNLADAIEASCPCLAFNLTGDEQVTDYAESQLGSGNVVGGFQARFLWNLLTRLKQTNEQITQLAHYDSLTGLPNRILFYDRLNQALKRARRYNTTLAVFYLDLDGFKLINDTLGHDAGDALLREVARRIVACVRESDTVARMGGDEFTVILCNPLTDSINNRVATQIVESLAQPFMINGKDCSVSVSIGIAVYPDHGDTAEQLVKISDATMYLAKRGGKNGYRFASE